MLYIIGAALLIASLWTELTIYVSALQEEEDAIYYVLITLTKIVGAFMILFFGIAHL